MYIPYTAPGIPFISSSSIYSSTSSGVIALIVFKKSSTFLSNSTTFISLPVSIISSNNVVVDIFINVNDASS